MSPHEDRSLSPPSFTEPVPTIGNPSSDPSSLRNDSSSGITSHGSYKAPEVQYITRILREKQGGSQAQGKNHRRVITINVLTDNVLLDIFDMCRKDHDHNRSCYPVWRWHELVHVCHRWRQIAFGSPQRLELNILCTNGTRMREGLNIWPPFPIAIQYSPYKTFTPADKDSLFAALEHPGRIRHIDLGITGPQLKEVATVMQVQFPVLTHLALGWKDERPPPLPSGFLGGSIPRLRHMHLNGVLFPALPTLLSSTSDLTFLSLDDIPHQGYIAPEEMVTCLGVLPKLKFFCIKLCTRSRQQWATSRAHRIRSLPVTRTSLPALTSLEFHGASKYLEELVSRIDSPQLNRIYTSYSNQFSDLQVARLFEFIDRSKDPEITSIRHAGVNFSEFWVTLEMYPFPESRLDLGLDRSHGRISAFIECRTMEGQVSYMAQIFGQPSALLSCVIHLNLSQSRVNTDCHVKEWLRLLRWFSAVRTLRVSWEFVGQIALVLEEVTSELVATVLPVLDLIYLGGQPVSCVEKFLAARRLSGHPVAIVDTEAEFNKRVGSYV
ncbi:hypothetical protein H4582DRAFT_335993 [Lactarius indigo]|nr:hypothetical protein H4582DRAFT_335993 [Lactarius indigo]